MVRSVLRLFVIPFVAGLLLGTLAALPEAWAADARSLMQTSSLGAVKSVKASQIASLKKAGLSTAARLAKADPAQVAKLLRVDSAVAGQIVRDAQATTRRLDRVYASARSKFPVKRVPGALSPEAAAYAELIAPSNECTILVRKVCGDANQCASSPGCPIAKELLNRYNAGSTEDIAGSCLAALEDPVVFNQCTQ